MPSCPKELVERAKWGLGAAVVSSTGSTGLSAASAGLPSAAAGSGLSDPLSSERSKASWSSGESEGGVGRLDGMAGKSGGKGELAHEGQKIKAT